MNRPSRVHAFQIFYSEQTRRQLDPLFTPLDNLANPRPDWREYWPMRGFLLTPAALDEAAYYGFFSPKFGQKTGLAASEVIRFADERTDLPDVISFSPYFDQIAMFLNVFEQGEAHHAGLMAAAQAFLNTTHLDVQLTSLVGHAGNTVYCNYFVARPRFWREWLRVNEALLALCEANATELARTLNALAMHEGSQSCPIKVFVMERTVSLLLMTGRFTCAAFNTMSLPRTNSPAAKLGDELLVADALKLAYCTTGHADYLRAFHTMRQTVIQRLAPRP